MTAWEWLGFGRDEMRARDRDELAGLCFDPLGVLHGSRGQVLKLNGFDNLGARNRWFCSWG